MPCNSCNKGLNNYINNSPTLLNCNYTHDMLVDWKDKLFCVRDKELYNIIGITKTQLNSFLGVVLSGISFEYNICFLSSKLDEIQPYILKIIDSGKC